MFKKVEVKQKNNKKFLGLPIAALLVGGLLLHRHNKRKAMED